jgi:hypothetical protein
MHPLYGEWFFYSCKIILKKEVRKSKERERWSTKFGNGSYLFHVIEEKT